MCYIKGTNVDDKKDDISSDPESTQFLASEELRRESFWNEDFKSDVKFEHLTKIRNDSVARK